MSCEACQGLTYFWGISMCVYIWFRLYGCTLKIQLYSCLHVTMLCSMFQGLGFASASLVQFFFFYATVLGMVFLWLAVSFCLKVGCLLTLHWGFCFDLLISIKGLLALMRGILQWGPLKVIMRYSPVTGVKTMKMCPYEIVLVPSDISTNICWGIVLLSIFIF